MPNEITPLINGKAYGWGDIGVVINGLPIIGISGIMYGESQEKANKYGAGRYPVARKVGRVTPMANITLALEVLMSIANTTPTGQLHRIAPFPITVTYQPESGAIVKDIIMNCEFKEQKRDWKEGDMDKDVTVELLISHIVWNKG